MRMKRRIRTDVCLILCGILVWFLADARQLRLEAAKALTLCAGTVIPALFPFMVVTGLLVRLGFAQWLAPDMAGLMASLFRLPGCAGSALLLGLVGGYPIGARTAAELYASGDLTRQEAERLLTFCNNSNPVFLISVLGAGVFGAMMQSGGFETMFVGMHRMLFINDNWLLNPATDILIRMMPQNLFETALADVLGQFARALVLSILLLAAAYAVVSGMVKRQLTQTEERP